TTVSVEQQKAIGRKRKAKRLKITPVHPLPQPIPPVKPQPKVDVVVPPVKPQLKVDVGEPIDPSTTELTDEKIDSDSSKNPVNEVIVSTEKPVEQKVDVGEPIDPSTTELTDDKIDSDSSKNPA
ncbi:hypothetical protein ADUPG1_003756, partial [Aduncisulcus paluster]